MDVMFQKMFAQLLFWLMEFLDALMNFFRILCGIEPVGMTGKSIIDIFLESSPIIGAFLGIFLISIFVMAICVIVSVVKSVLKAKENGERKSHAKTVAQGFGSIITSLVMAVVMILGITVSNGVLGLVDDATRQESNLTLSQQIFAICVKAGYEWEQLEDPITGLPLYETVDCVDSNGNIIYITDEEGNSIPKTEQKPVYGYNLGKPTNGWLNGSNPSDIVFGKTTVDEVFGIRDKSFFGLFEDSGKGYKRSPMVEMNSFNMFLAYFAVVILLVAICWSMLGLVKRLYDLVFLFLCLPLISATIPLDDGARFKAWRESVMSKVVLAYGAVLSINVYMLMLPVIMNLNFGISTFIDGVARVFLIIGGALAINGGQLLMARLMGTSAEEGREMAQSARALVAGGAAAAGGIMAVKRGLIGGTNRYGKATKGVLGTAAKVGGGLTNVAGNVLGGAAYRRAAGALAGGVGAAAGSVGGFLRGLTHINRPTAPQASGGAGGAVGSVSTAGEPSARYSRQGAGGASTFPAFSASGKGAAAAFGTAAARPSAATSVPAVPPVQGGTASAKYDRSASKPSASVPTSPAGGAAEKAGTAAKPTAPIVPPASGSTESAKYERPASGAASATIPSAAGSEAENSGTAAAAKAATSSDAPQKPGKRQAFRTAAHEATKNGLIGLAGHAAKGVTNVVQKRVSGVDPKTGLTSKGLLPPLDKGLKAPKSPAFRKPKK